MAHRNGTAVLWSDRTGTFLRTLDASGAPTAPKERLGAPCPAGLAAQAGDAGLWIACSRPADPDRGREGAVALWQWSPAHAVQPVTTFTPVGPTSRGVAILRREQTLTLAWQSAWPWQARTWQGQWRPGVASTARAVSDPLTLAGPPALGEYEGSLISAWTESWLDADGGTEGRLAVQIGDGLPRTSLPLWTVLSPVQLFGRDSAPPAVSLRDTQGAPSERVFLGQLTRHLRLTPESLRSPQRADGGAAPILISCGGHHISLALRRSSRDVTMVTIRRLNEDLQGVEAEQQIYRYHSRFTDLAAACAGESLVIATVEKRDAATPYARLRTFSYRCGPGLRHQRTPGVAHSPEDEQARSAPDPLLF